MSYYELPQQVLFIIFLLIFVLSGLYPALKKGAAKIRRSLGKSEEEQVAAEHKVVSRGQQTAVGSLNSYESLVFRRLAQSGGKGLSRHELERDLHLLPQNLQRTLKSLGRRGLIAVTVSRLLRMRFSLSDKGQRWAAERDMIPQLRRR